MLTIEEQQDRFDNLIISELFGPTLQGEGRSQGKQVAFIRLALCNLDCRWCDTPYTWDWTGKNGKKFDRQDEVFTMPFDEVLDWCAPFRRIVISGGEPLIQKKRLIPFTNRLLKEEKIIEIETNGTISPHGFDEKIRFTVSPKINNSGVAWNKAIKPEILEEFRQRWASYKFVVSTPDDLIEIESLRTSLGIHRSQMWIMPEGRTREEILEKLPWLFDAAASLGWSLAPRLHVLAHNDRRGV